MSNENEIFIKAREKLAKTIGTSAWQVHASIHAFKLFERQASITIDDIILLLEAEAKTSRQFEIINKEVILKLHDLQAHQQSE